MTDLALFFGRFHPLIVHLPIGFILLAAILEAYTYLDKDKSDVLQLPIKITLFASVAASVLAFILGLLLASQGGYDLKTLAWHKWMSLCFTSLVFITLLVKLKVLKVNTKTVSGLLLGSVISISITGHLGGNLTHGSDYLVAYAPAFIKKVLNKEEDFIVTAIPSHPDSVIIFEHLIKPVLKEKCYSCHNVSKMKGGLLMTSIEGLTNGGDTGHAILGGKSHKSSIFNRVTLRQSEEKFMPPSGIPLTYSEIKLLQWWIDEGASYDQMISEVFKSREIKHILRMDYRIETDPIPFIERHPIPPLDSISLVNLSLAGWMVKPISQNVNYLEISGNKKSITNKMLTTLLAAKDHIAWIDLSRMHLNDNHLKKVSQLINLTKLKVQNNNITDLGIHHLSTLINLELLNLYNNSVSDVSMNTIKNLNSLKSLYVWQTDVTSEGIENLKSVNAELNIIGSSNNF